MAASSDFFPYVDRNGHPLGVGCFVRVERESKTFGPIRFQGLVIGARMDPAHGDLLDIRVWHMGAWTGGVRLARPEQCEVRRKPAGVKEEEAALVGAKLRLAQTGAKR